MKKQNTIVIVGAGIVGMLAAILLRKSKIPDETQIIIIEKSDMDFHQVRLISLKR
jgi:2-polyprenyl-6-methoxyphenol hydroxylase-like FAD-dependent oxidoreductase